MGFGLGQVLGTEGASSQMVTQAGGSGSSAAGYVAGGSGLIGGIGQMIAAPFMAKRQRRHEELMSDKAFAQNMKAWEIQNEYNHPAKQMERFAEAGLNPHLIYGKGTPGNAVQPHKYEKPGSPYPKTLDFSGLNFTQNYLDALQKKENINLTKQAVEEKRLANEFGSNSLTTRLNTADAMLENIKANINATNVKANLDSLQLEIRSYTKQLQKDANTRELEEYTQEGITKANSWRIRGMAKIIEKLETSGLQRSDWIKVLMYIFMPDGGARIKKPW